MARLIISQELDAHAPAQDQVVWNVDKKDPSKRTILSHDVVLSEEVESFVGREQVAVSSSLAPSTSGSLASDHGAGAAGQAGDQHPGTAEEPNTNFNQPGRHTAHTGPTRTRTVLLPRSPYHPASTHSQQGDHEDLHAYGGTSR